MEFKIVEDRPNANVVVLSIVGRLNVLTAGDLKNRFKALVSEGHYNLVLELSGVTFIDSSGLSAIVSGLKSTRESEGSIKLVGLGPSTKKVFELTRLDRVFEFYTSIGDALSQADS